MDRTVVQSTEKSYVDKTTNNASATTDDGSRELTHDSPLPAVNLACTDAFNLQRFHCLPYLSDMRFYNNKLIIVNRPHNSNCGAPTCPQAGNVDQGQNVEKSFKCVETFLYYISSGHFCQILCL